MAGALLIIIIVVMWAGLGFTVAKRRALAARSGKALSPDYHDRLECCIDLIRKFTEKGEEEVFAVKIRGRINAPTPGHETDVQIIIADTTENESYAQPVLCSVQKWQMEDSPAFYHRAFYGKLVQASSTLTYWTTALELPAAALTLPRRGIRRLRFTVSLLSRGTENEITSARSAIQYNCHRPGYIDITENARLTETLTIQLAAAALGPENIDNESAAEVLDSWFTAKVEAIDDPQARTHVINRLANTAQDAAILCKTGQGLDADAICERFTAVSSIADRYAAIELALRMLSVHYTGSTEQNDFASCLAKGLQIENDKFRAMVQKLLPIMQAPIRDSNFLLGIQPDMSAETIRAKLSSEYKKWNSRVNHPDAAVRAKADFMLELIADARSKCATA